MHRRPIGVDLAISAAQVSQIFDDGIPVGRPIRFRLDPEEPRRFTAMVTAGVPPGVPIRAVMEPTGMAWFPVASGLGQAGVEVNRVKGQRVKALRRCLSNHAKTDLADAHVLGALPRFGGQALDPVHVPTAEQHALQRLTKQRHRYQERICSSRRRVLDLIRWACPALEAVLPDTMTRLTLAVLAEYFDPRRVLQVRRATLVRIVGENASGNHPHQGPFVEHLVDRLREAARTTLTLHGDRVDFESLQFEVRQEIELMRMLDSNVAELDRRAETLYRGLHPGDSVRSITGIGLALVPLLVSVLAAPGQFRNERHIRGYCGLFPTKTSSGGIDRPGQRITRNGNDRVKRARYLAADTARQIDPDLAAVYWRMMVTRGHHQKQTLCAVATRLVSRIFRVLKTGHAHELRDLDGRPTTVTEGKRILAERFTVPAEIRRTRRRHVSPIRREPYSRPAPEQN